MTKRIIAILVILVIATSFSLAGCGAGQSSTQTSASSAASNVQSTTAASESASQTTASSEPVTIKVAWAVEFSEDYAKAYQKDHPNVTIQLTSVSMDKLMAMLAAGTAPDIVRVFAYNDFPSLVSRGLVLNLDDYVAKSTKLKVEDMLPAANSFRWDGKKLGQGSIYGLVKDWSADTFLYMNKKAFTDAGVTPPPVDKPLTWSQVADYSKKISKIVNGKNESFGLDTLSWPLADVLNLRLAQEGKSLWSDDYKSININTPEAKEILQYFADGMKAGYFTSPMDRPTDLNGDFFRVKNKLGFYLTGFWFSAIFRGDPKLQPRLGDFALLPTPIPDEGKGQRLCTSLSDCGGIILKSCKYPDEAFKVMEYFLGSQDQPAKDRASAGWGLPVYKSLMNLVPQNTDFDKQCYNTVNDDLKYFSGNVQYDPYLSNVGLNGLFDKYFTPVVAGKSTLDEAVAQIEKEANTLIAEGMEIAGAN